MGPGFFWWFPKYEQGAQTGTQGVLSGYEEELYCEDDRATAEAAQGALLSLLL